MKNASFLEGEKKISQGPLFWGRKYLANLGTNYFELLALLASNKRILWLESCVKDALWDVSHVNKNVLSWCVMVRRRRNDQWVEIHSSSLICPINYCCPHLIKPYKYWYQQFFSFTFVRNETPATWSIFRCPWSNHILWLQPHVRRSRLRKYMFSQLFPSCGSCKQFCIHKLTSLKLYESQIFSS